MSQDLRCPHYDESLTADGLGLICPRGHRFDRARQGYVNLLRPTRAQGDTADMLRARRRFLEAGYYAPLAAAVTKSVAAWLGSDGAQVEMAARALVDCGCGEGYYLDYVAIALGNNLRAHGWRLYGFGLARDAARMAAGRRYGASDDGARAVTLAVASMWDRLPFADAGIGAALVIFAPRNPAELARIVVPGGLLLVVTPAPDHLAEARAALPALLAPQPEKAARLRAALAPAFLPVRERAVHFSFALDGAALADLAEMTPHRAAPNTASDNLRQQAHNVADAASEGHLAVTADCVVAEFARA